MQLVLMTDSAVLHTKCVYWTDIALSLYYLFNLVAKEPPILYGHIRDGKLRYDDIFQRAGSIYYKLTVTDKNRLGWDETFDREFINRKKALIKHQYNYLDVLI